MPDEQKEKPAEPETPSSPTPPSGESGKEQGEYRYPNDPNLPDWARGKTAAEILALTQQLVDDRVRGTQRQEPQQQYQPPQGYQPTQQYQSNPGDEDYVTGKDLKALRQAAMAELQPHLQQVMNQNAAAAYRMAKREYADVFKKYEPEIVAVLGNVDRSQWSLDVIENAVKFVRGNHVDELAEEKARQLAAQMEPTIRSTGSGGSAPVSPAKPEHSLDSEKLPVAWRERAKRAGITEQEVQELCWATGITPEQFFKQFDFVTDAVTEVSMTGERTR